jgi:hypothetical protein
MPPRSKRAVIARGRQQRSRLTARACAAEGLRPSLKQQRELGLQAQLRSHTIPLVAERIPDLERLFSASLTGAA